MPFVTGDELKEQIKRICARYLTKTQASHMSNWISIDFSILPPYKEAEEGHIPSDEEYEGMIKEDEMSDQYIEEDYTLPDDICTHCFTKLKWINLYYQCTDCKRIYG